MCFCNMHFLLLSLCPFFLLVLQLSDEGESRVVVGTLDLNQCLRLPEEITGAKPKVPMILLSSAKFEFRCSI